MAASLGGLLVLRFSRDLPDSQTRSGRIAALPIAAIAAVAALPAAGIALFHVVTALTWPAKYWTLSVNDSLRMPLFERSGWSAFGMIGCAVIVAAVLAVLRVLRRFAFIPVTLAALGLLSGAAMSGSLLTSTAGFTALAIASSVLIRLVRTNNWGVRNVLIATSLLAALSVFIGGWSSADLWLWATFTAVLALIGTRIALVGTRVVGVSFTWKYLPGLITGLATVLAMVTLTGVMDWLITIAAVRPGATALDRAFWPAAGAAALLVAAGSMSRDIRSSRHARAGATRGDLRAVAIVTGVTALVGSVAVVTAGEGLIVATTAGSIVMALLIAAGIVWQFSSKFFWAERIALAALTPLAMAALASLTVGAFARVTVTTDAAQIAVSIAAVVAAALGLTLLGTARSVGTARAEAAANGSAALIRRERYAWGAATLIVVLMAAAFASADGGSWAWLAVLLSASAPLLIASGEGDIFTGNHKRRHIAWVSLPLATAGLWQGLAYQDVGGVEPYTLPVAGLLLVLVVLIAWKRRSAASHNGRNALAFAGLVIALVPSVVVSGDGANIRPILLIVIGASLALGSLRLPTHIAGVRVRALAMGFGVLAVSIPGMLRDFTLIHERGLADWRLEAWIAPGVIVASVVAIRYAVVVPGGAGGASARMQAGLLKRSLLVAYPAALFALAELSAVVTGEHARYRAVIVLALFAAAHVIAQLIDEVAVAIAISRTSVVALGVIGLISLSVRAADPFELITVPIAVGLIAAGLLRLQQHADSRTWPELGWGIAVLVVPSVMPDFWDSPVWRVVGLGIACLVIIAVSLVNKWQAPLMMAGVVLIVHAVAQLWPWISSAYSAMWWLWLGFGGVILIVIAATYESRIKNFRSVALQLRSLR